MSEDVRQITTTLLDWRNGDKEAGDRLMVTAYNELRRIAAKYMSRERREHTLQGTALVHELYLRLFSGAPVNWQDRAHFLAVASQQLRRILVDHARTLRAEKRGGNRVRVSLTSGANGWSTDREQDLVDLDDAMNDLEQLDPRAARIVELRFFGGLTETDVAEAIGVSLATVKRNWSFAKAWLKNRLMPSSDEPSR
jgi:RNA polymerase sigma factor (TIGR02999 family)